MVPEICSVTVDDFGDNNLIYWDKTFYQMADTFFVYRDTSNNAYGLIGKVSYDSYRGAYKPCKGFIECLHFFVKRNTCHNHNRKYVGASCLNKTNISKPKLTKYLNIC